MVADGWSLFPAPGVMSWMDGWASAVRRGDLVRRAA